MYHLCAGWKGSERQFSPSSILSCSFRNPDRKKRTEKEKTAGKEILLASTLKSSGIVRHVEDLGREGKSVDDEDEQKNFSGCQ